jgi:hypothetical protein
MDDRRVEVNNLIVEADAEMKSGNKESALDLYDKAKSLANEIDWNERIIQIEDIIKNIHLNEEKFKKKEELQKKIEAEKQEKLEKEKKLDDARQRMQNKKQTEREKKMEMLRKKKEEETKLSSEAYDLLEVGSKLLEAENFKESIEKFTKAVELFSTIKWPAEAKRIKELIEDTQQKYDKHLKNQEKIEEEKNELVESKKKYEEMAKTSQNKEELIKKEKDQKESETINKSQIENEISNKAFALLDDSNDLAKNNNFSDAITKLQEAKQIFQDIGWKNEADKILLQISAVKKKQKFQEKDKQIQEEANLKKQKELEEMEKAALASKRLQEKEKMKEQEKLQKEQDDKQYAKSVADEIFKMIDHIEAKIKEYTDKVKSGQILTSESPYEQAIAIYKKGYIGLRDIGWPEESARLQDGLRLYEEKFKQDQKLRDLESKKIENKRAGEEDFKKQVETGKRIQLKKEQEDQIKIQKEQSKHQKEQKTHSECMDLLDQAQIVLKKEEYEQAIKIYREVLGKYESIQYSDGIRLTKDSLIKIQKDFEVHKTKKEVSQKAFEDKEAENAALEERISKAKSDEERKKLEAKQKILAEHMKKEKTDRIQNEIIDLLEISNDLTKKNNFDEAIANYEKCLELLKEITWPMKDQQIRDTIQDTKTKKEKYLLKNKKAEEDQQKKKQEQEVFEEKIRRQEAERKFKKQKAREEEKNKNKELQSEKNLSDKAWGYLDSGEKNVKSKKEYLAVYSFHHAYYNFNKVKWTREAETSKKRLLQIYNSMKNPIVDINEILSNDDLEMEENLLSEINQCFMNRLKKDFPSAIKNQLKSVEYVQTLKWPKTFNLIQNFQEILKQEEIKYNEQQANKDNIPNEENAFKLLDQAKIKEKRMQYMQAIELGTKAKSMFLKIGWEREAKMVDQELVRWKFKAEKISDEIHEATSKTVEKRKIENDLLSEEERAQAIIDERKRKRREGRRKP